MRPGQGLLFIVFALLVTGTVLVNSAGLTSANGSETTLQELLVGRNTMFLLAALAALWLGTRIRVESIFTRRGWSSPMPWLLGVILLGLLLAHVPGIGKEVNGAKRWIALGPLSFQPSEIAKWGVPLIVAWHCCRRAGALGTFWQGFIQPFALVSVICALVAVEDLGTAVLIMVVALAMLVSAGVRWWHVGLLLPLAGAAFVGLVVTSPYRVNRILAYLDPFADAQGKGYHVIQSMAAISGGGLPGRGLGNGIQKFGYLPEATTDFIFSIACEELGMGGAIGILLLFAMLAFTGLAIASASARVQTPGGEERRVPLTTNYESLVALGFTLTVSVQALINVAVVTGLAPTKGIALPLISRGGTGWILTAFSLGMLASIARVSEGRRRALEVAGVAQPESDEGMPQPA
jgi:cell division protein FtsW